MLEDIRNHDANPTTIEREWMAIDAVEVVMKSIVLAVVALTIGISAALMVGPIDPAPAVSSSAER
jgi:hypothetical protein